MNEYVKTLVEGCFKGMVSGFDTNDYKKVWRSYYRLKDVLTIATRKEEDEIDYASTD